MEAADEGIDRMEDSKDLQQQSKAFDKLTDRVEDRQLDSTRVQEVLLSLFKFRLLILYFFLSEIKHCKNIILDFGMEAGFLKIRVVDST